MEKSAAQHVDPARVKEIFILALSLTADARTLALMSCATAIQLFGRRLSRS